jgi:hypothetical protein
MKFKQILGRLTGISIPVFGVSWNPPEPEIEIAKRIIIYLEDRRVLFNPSSLEIPAHCVQSIIEIRHYLTDELSRLNPKSELAVILQALRAACRKFLNQTEKPNDEIIKFGVDKGHWASWHFLPALGELRGVFGMYLAMISTSYGLDIGDELATILPEKPSGNRKD